ncbi:MAG: EpsI family protein, partial [Proteobacteria bacterium]|nr:EpsI family protein [Pseudomonadota bacterium]
FKVTEGCSGVQFLTVALATAALYAFLERLPRRSALMLLALSAVVAELANWIRIVAIIEIGHVTHMQSPIVEHHDVLSWGIFAAAMVPFLWLARRHAPAAAPAAAVAAEPTPASNRSLLAAVSAATALLALGPLAALALQMRAAHEPVPTLSLPAVAGWQGPVPAAGPWHPRFPGAAASELASYRASDAVIDAFVAFYSVQVPRGKLLGDRSSLAGPGGWAEHPQPRPATVPAVNETVLVNRAGQGRLVWFWYEVRGERETSVTRVKWKMMALLAGAAPRYGVVALSTDCETTCEAARSRLASIYARGLSALTAGTAAK